MSEPITLRWRDEVLTSTLTDAEAAAACDRIPADHPSRSYTQSLVLDLRRYGSLFDNKRYWLHAHAAGQIERERPASQREPSGYLPRIAAFLTPVSNRIKSGARVAFESGSLKVVIKRAGERSNWPGHFHVMGFGFGADNDKQIYAGRISDTGERFPSGACTSEVFALLDEFEVDPAEYAAAYGRRTGRCAFCDLPLTDAVSMGMGYGRICSKHYRLPYGKRALAAAFKCREAKKQEVS